MDTIYYDLKITLPDDHLDIYPRRRYHSLEIHYHPVAKSKNYLHIKMKAGGSAQNKVEPGNWLIDKARLTAGVKAWNDDGRVKSTDAF